MKRSTPGSDYLHHTCGMQMDFFLIEQNMTVGEASERIKRLFSQLHGLVQALTIKLI